MDIKKLQKLVIDALEDVKAQDIHLYDTTHLTSLFDRIAIASGTSNRQTKALAASVRDKVKQAGGNVLSMEGENTGEWVLVDLGDMVVHIMQPTIRAYYRLEELWGDKAVSVTSAKRITKATASKPTTAKAVPKKSSKLAAEAAEVEDAPKKRAPRKTVSKTTTSAVTKTATTKAPVKKAASPRKPAAPKAETVTSKKPVASKPAKVAAPKAKATASKAPTKLTSVKRKVAE